MSFADDGGEVLAVCVAEGGEVCLEAGFEGLAEGDEAVFPAFGVVDGDGAVAGVEVSVSLLPFVLVLVLVLDPSYFFRLSPLRCRRRW